MYGLTCLAGGCQGPCEDLAGKYGKYEFDSCPFSTIKTPRWCIVLELHAAAQVCPLEQWPGGWAPWVVRALSDLKTALDLATAEAQKEAWKNGSKRRDHPVNF